MVAVPGRAGAVAGGDAPAELNYVVPVRVSDAASGLPVVGCSGAAVASDWVLTRAACLRQVGAAPATNGAAPLKPVSAGGSEVTLVVVHPTADVALLRTKSGFREPSGVRKITVAATAPAVGDAVSVGGFGRTADEWVPLRPHQARFTVRSASSTAFDVTPEGTGSVCKGDAGGPVARTVAGRTELVGLVGTGSQGGCLEAAATTDHDATVVRVDGLSKWIGGWTLNTGFEDSDPVPFANTPAAGSGAVVAVSGICCSLTGPELGVRAEDPHSGSKVLMYSGKDDSETKSYAYMKAYTAPSLPVTSTTLLRYWIYPEDPALEPPLQGPASRLTDGSCVAVDLDFSDGKHLRDLKAYASNGATDSHPARQCGHLTIDAWNQVTIDVGQVAAGKKITQVNVGYDRPDKYGKYRGLIDDVEIFQGCLAHGTKTCPAGSQAPATR